MAFRGTRGHRRSMDRVSFSLMVHGPEYGSGEELVINPECFSDIKVLDLLELSQPTRDHQRLILRVTSLVPVRGKLQVSVLKEIAAQFGLDPYQEVLVQKTDPQEVTLDFIELTFKDQYLSRGDIWRYKNAMHGECVYVGKTVETIGVRSQVAAVLLPANEGAQCGVVGTNTKIVVRSRSSRIFWLVQMSTEMWEFAADGELHYEKLINRLLRVLIDKWTECSVSHSVTVITFSRSFYDKDQFPNDYDPESPRFSEPWIHNCDASELDEPVQHGPNIRVDSHSGRYYEDFYKVLVMNYTGPDWSRLLQLLKAEFASYHKAHRWRTPDQHIPVEYSICRPVFQCDRYSGSKVDSHQSKFEMHVHDEQDTECPKSDTIFARWKTLPYGVPARAKDGNILEAINVTLNTLDRHYIDRDLNRTGASIVMLTAGTSVFAVDEQLSLITQQRMMDNGVGMDMISLTTPPLHAVPLFINRGRPNQTTEPSATVHKDVMSTSAPLHGNSHRGFMQQPSSHISLYDEGDHELTQPHSTTTKTKQVRYTTPHWVNVTFLDLDRQCECKVCSGNTRSQVSLCSSQRKSEKDFSPLPPFRMLDLADPKSKRVFPVPLTNQIKSAVRACVTITAQNEPSEGFPDENSSARRGDGLLQPGMVVFTNGMDHSPEANIQFRSRIEKSPDCPNFLASGLNQLMSNFNASLFAREALQEYDTSVFSFSGSNDSQSSIPPAQPLRRRHSPSVFSPPYDGNDCDITSMTLTGGMLHLDKPMSKHGRWKINKLCVDILECGESRSTTHAMLSPRSSKKLQQQETMNKIQGTDPVRNFIAPRDIPLLGSAQNVKAPKYRNKHAQDVSPVYNTLQEDGPLLSYLRKTERSDGESDKSNNVGFQSNRAAHGQSKQNPECYQEPGVSKLASSIESTGSWMSTHIPMSSSISNCSGGAGSSLNINAQVSKLISASSPLHLPKELQPSLPTLPSLHHVKLRPHLPFPPHKCASAQLDLSSSFQNSPASASIENLAKVCQVNSDYTHASSSWSNHQIKHHMAEQLHVPTCVNPFKYTSESTNGSTTRSNSGRQRWSHLFPHSGDNETASHSPRSSTEIHSGLTGPHWQSLTSPAILPLTTDFFPTLHELQSQYTESFYTLTLPASDSNLFPKYNSHKELLVEMVCQRLASDFQLVGTSSAGGPEKSYLRTNSVLAAGDTSRRRLREKKPTKISYHLTMGHRIHQIICDVELQTINVKRFFARASQAHRNDRNFYRYSLWAETTRSFQPQEQTFHEFPIPESNWNSLDHLLCGYHDEMSEMVKPRRIRFAILPPEGIMTRGMDEKSGYALQFSKFLGYLQSRVVAADDAMDEQIEVETVLDPSTSANVLPTNGTRNFKIDCCSTQSYTRLKRGDTRQEWVMIRLENTMRVDKNYHFEVLWLACSGIIVDDFVSTIRRKAKQAMLDLRRVPEFSNASLHQIHPLVAASFLRVSPNILQGTGDSNTLMDLLVSQLEFVLDDVRLIAISASHGGSVRKKPCRRSQAHRRSAVSQGTSTVQLQELWRQRGYKQYMHRYLAVFLRVTHDGIVWIPNYEYMNDPLADVDQVKALFSELCALIHTSSVLHHVVSAVECGKDS